MQRKRYVIYPKSSMEKRERFARICRLNHVITVNMNRMRKENEEQLKIRRDLEKFAHQQRNITNQKVLLSVDHPDKNIFFIQEAQLVEEAFAKEKQRRIQVLEAMLQELKS